jgi:outer membrane protein assembly factor BamB
MSARRRLAAIGLAMVVVLAAAVVGTRAIGRSTPQESASARAARQRAEDCSRSVHPADAPADLGLTVGTASPPAWSARLGAVAAVVAGQIVSATGGDCVRSADARTGTPEWSWAPSDAGPVMGVLATRRLVLVATGHTHGQAPAAVLDVTDALVALDPRTGRQRWSRSIEPDGQTVPAVIEGGTVVVATGDGTVLGLDVATGRRRWSDQVVPGCGTPVDFPEPAAMVLPGGPAATVLARCHGQQLVRIVPRSGAVRWRVMLPGGDPVDGQLPVATSGGVLGVLTGQVDVRRASLRLLGIDARTGRLRWQAGGLVAGEGQGVYGGADRLCLLSSSGADCRRAGTGATVWHTGVQVAPPAAGFDPRRTGVVAAAGRLYVVVPTAAAASIPRGSTTYRSPPGVFRLQVLSLASGRVIEDHPLPAYYGGAGGVVVSRGVPPGVLAVGPHLVLVSPQLDETDVVEALPAGAAT